MMLIDEFILQPQMPGENGGLFLLSLDERVYVHEDIQPGADLDEIRAEAREEAARQAADLGADAVEFVGDDPQLNQLTLVVDRGVGLALETLAAAKKVTRGEVLRDCVGYFVDAILDDLNVNE